VLTADEEVMSAYAELVADAELRARFLGPIRRELALTVAALEELYGGPLAAKRPRVHGLLALRSDGLRAVHRRQLDLLRRLRGSEGEEVLPALLATVNAIAAGLRTTG
jgi:phosphoenolpyruvate carboxylase